MDVTVTLLGALIGMALAIILILIRVNPTYSMILGALAGGIIGGAGMADSISLMLDGVKNIVPTIVRIVAAGTLAGTLAASGAAETISDAIIKAFGKRFSIVALVVCGWILCVAGIFGDVVILTVAPIGLDMAYKLRMSRRSIIICLIGGVMSGVICGPIANTIAAAEIFEVPLTSVMLAGLIPSIAGIAATVFCTMFAADRGEIVTDVAELEEKTEKPKLIGAISGPVVTIVLLLLDPIIGITIDPIIAMPVGAIVGAIAMRRWSHFRDYMEYGLGKMSGVVMLLIGTGCLAGIISNSDIQEAVISAIEFLGLPSFILAPLSGILMGAATASASAGATVASQIFGPALLEAGVGAVGAAAMINIGAVMLAGLPHGSFFHVSAGSVQMDLKERLKVIPYEAVIGGTTVIVSTIVLGVFGLFG